MCIPLGWNMYTHWPAQTFLYDRSKLHRGTFLQQINLPLYKKRLFCQMLSWLKTSLNLEKPKYYLQIIICVHFNLLELLDEWESPREVRYSKLSITEKHVTLTFRNFSVIVFWDLLLVPFLEKSTHLWNWAVTPLWLRIPALHRNWLGIRCIWLWDLRWQTGRQLDTQLFNFNAQCYGKEVPESRHLDIINSWPEK